MIKSSHGRILIALFKLFFLKSQKKESNADNKILIVCSLLPLFIRKLLNFNNGNSKFFALREWLFLKHIGTSIILSIKNEINEDFRNGRKVLKTLR
jgi:hypothetical protein